MFVSPAKGECVQCGSQFMTPRLALEHNVFTGHTVMVATLRCEPEKLVTINGK